MERVYSIVTKDGKRIAVKKHGNTEFMKYLKAEGIPKPVIKHDGQLFYYEQEVTKKKEKKVKKPVIESIPIVEEVEQPKAPEEEKIQKILADKEILVDKIQKYNQEPPLYGVLAVGDNEKRNMVKPGDGFFLHYFDILFSSLMRLDDVLEYNNLIASSGYSEEIRPIEIKNNYGESSPFLCQEFFLQNFETVTKYKFLDYILLEGTPEESLEFDSLLREARHSMNPPTYELYKLKLANGKYFYKREDHSDILTFDYEVMGYDFVNKKQKAQKIGVNYPFYLLNSTTFDHLLEFYMAHNDRKQMFLTAIDNMQKFIPRSHVYVTANIVQSGLKFKTVTATNLRQYVRDNQLMKGIFDRLEPEDAKELFNKAVERIKDKDENKKETVVTKGEDPVFSDMGDDGLDSISIFQAIFSVEMKDLSKQLKVQQTGELFPYLNKSHHDLLEYQIISYPEEIDICKEHCLVYALIKNGVKKDELYVVRDLIGAGSYQKRKLREIATALDRNIHLYHFITDETKIKRITYNVGSSEPTIKLALFQGHYLKFNKTKKTGYANILVLLKKLWDNGQFVTHSCFLQVPEYGNNTEDTTINTRNQKQVLSVKPRKVAHYKCTIESMCKECNDIYCSFSEDDSNSRIDFMKKPLYVFADTECHTEVTHVPFRHGFIVEDMKYTIISDNFYDHLDKIKTVCINRGRQWALVYYHNLKYDFSVIKHDPHITIRNIVDKDGSIYSVTLIFKGFKFELRDSYKFLSMPLAKFAKTFKLDAGKQELIIYKLYHADNVYRNSVSVKPFEGECESVYDIKNGKIVIPEFVTEKDYLLLDDRIAISKNLAKAINKQMPGSNLIVEPKIGFRGKVFDGYYKHIEHNDHYLHFDCMVLRDGMLKFMTLMKDALGVEVSDYLTISSLAHNYAIGKKAYKGIFSINGTTRNFITKCMSGGRVCSNFNTKNYTKKRTELIDVTSLYPAAMERFGKEIGFPKGEFSKIYGHEHFLELRKKGKMTYYFIEIISNQDTKEQGIAFPRIKKNNKIIYTNKIKGETLYLGRLAFEDLEMFCGLKDYKFVKGIYWDVDNGTNKRLGQCARDLFNQRLKAKKDDNETLGDCIKLALNSLYGKNMLSKSKTTTVCRREGKKSDSFMAKNMGKILNYKTYGKTNIFKVESKSIYEYNNIHVACMILDMSKHIMNEVIDLAQENGMVIMYTDTDSCHLINDDGQLEKLEKLFMDKYGKVLNGKDLGQFHPDFVFEDHHDIYAVETIVIDKKVYLDVVRGLDDKTNEEHFKLHSRYKGINDVAKAYACKDCKRGEIDLFMDLLRGEEITFNLLANEKISINTSAMFTYSRAEFTRKGHFPSKHILVH